MRARASRSASPHRPEGDGGPEASTDSDDCRLHRRGGRRPAGWVDCVLHCVFAALSPNGPHNWQLRTGQDPRRLSHPNRYLQVDDSVGGPLRARRENGLPVV